MRLRRFEATTVAEALARVREDLGAEAVILHARTVTEAERGGWVEVTAAVDEDGQPRQPQSRHRRADHGRSRLLPLGLSGLAVGHARRERGRVQGFFEVCQGPLAPFGLGEDLPFAQIGQGSAHIEDGVGGVFG